MRCGNCWSSKERPAIRGPVFRDASSFFRPRTFPESTEPRAPEDIISGKTARARAIHARPPHVSDRMSGKAEQRHPLLHRTEESGAETRSLPPAESGVRKGPHVGDVRQSARQRPQARRQRPQTARDRTFRNRCRHAPECPEGRITEKHTAAAVWEWPSSGKSSNATAGNRGRNPNPEKARHFICSTLGRRQGEREE